MNQQMLVSGISIFGSSPTHSAIFILPSLLFLVSELFSTVLYTSIHLYTFSAPYSIPHPIRASIPSIWCTPKELIGTALVFLGFQYELEHRIKWPIKPSCLESVIWKFYWKGSHPNLKALLYVSFPLCMEYYASPKSKPSPKSLGKPLGQVFKPGFVSIIIHKNLLSLSRHYFASPPSLFNVINQHNHDHYHYHHHHYQL